MPLTSWTCARSRSIRKAPAASSIPRRCSLSLLLYSYATGVFSSRRIEQSTYESVLGFRRFMRRGLEKAKWEWTLVSTAYNLKRLHRMVGTV